MTSLDSLSTSTRINIDASPGDVDPFHLVKSTSIEIIKESLFDLFASPLEFRPPLFQRRDCPENRCSKTRVSSSAVFSCFFAGKPRTPPELV